MSGVEKFHNDRVCMIDFLDTVIGILSCPLSIWMMTFYQFFIASFDIGGLNRNFKIKYRQGTVDTDRQIHALRLVGVVFLMRLVPFESVEWVRKVATHEGVDNWARSYGPGRSVPHCVMTDDGLNLVVGHIGEEIPSLIIMCRMNLAEPAKFVEFLARTRCPVRSVLPASWPLALMHVSVRGRSQALQNR